MPGLNKLSLIGNLGADPELRYTQDGKAVTNLRLATNRSWPDGNGGWNEESIWFQVSLWEDRAERAAEKMRKGDQVYVEGRLKPVRQYTRNDGTVGVSLEVHAHTVFKLGKSERSEDSQLTGDDAYLSAGAPRQEPRVQPEMDVDDIPF